ncbi:MAG: deoxyribodipyrimidine photolyase [Bacteroidetes bacterium]|nr:deoxyribodipyrimidine photolyase [Bacteroidota bacterium]
MQFPIHYPDILKLINAIDPIEYGKTRNFTTGAVSFLSPYIARGVISTRQILDRLEEKGYSTDQLERLMQQMSWREFFQRTWQYAEDDILDDMRLRYTGTRHQQIPEALLRAETGIDAVDDAVAQLYQTGYIHNHLRMYIASIACNVGKADWKTPASWMYYHLLDGDLASNALSWQWVTGHFSSKQYYCNQENINKYTGMVQRDTFLDYSYEILPHLEIPHILNRHIPFSPLTVLPEKKVPVLDPTLPLLLYTSYNLDPNWKKDIAANRILLLEPSHFRKHPVSERVLRFILALAGNISGLQVFTGELNEIPGLASFPAVYSKEHPLYKHFPGTKDDRDWLFPEVSGSFHSFFSYWKKCGASMRKKEKNHALLQRA